MAERVMGDAPRIVGIAGDGSGAGAGALVLGLARAMIARAARVAVAAVDPARRPVVPIAHGARCGNIPEIVLPVPPAPDAFGRESVRVAIEVVARGMDRVLLDLGPATSPDAAFFGAAVDELIVWVDARDGAGHAAASLVEQLGRRGCRHEVMIVVAGPPATDSLATAFQALGGAALAVRPRLVPLGSVSLGRVSRAPEGESARTLERIAGELLRPRPARLRGGPQFFLEDRVVQGRAA